MGISGGGAANPGEETPKLPAQLEALEHALKGMHGCTRALLDAPRSTFDLRPLGEEIGQAIRLALEGYDGRTERIAALLDAAAATEAFAASLSRAADTDPGLAPAVEWARTSLGWLRKAVDSPGVDRSADVRPFAASMLTPQLHAVVRPTLAPKLTLAAPLPPPPAPPEPIDPTLPPAERLAVAKLRAEARQTAARERREARAAHVPVAREPSREATPGFVPGVHRADTIEEAVRKKARECFEDVTGLGLMRTPLLGDDWRAVGTLDQRLMAVTDAIVGLGPVALDALERFVSDAPAKDPSRGFAIAFIAGSLEGRDALAVVERALVYLDPADPETQRAFADALALVPHPDLPALLRRWATDESASLRALGIHLLARRGLATHAELARALADNSPEVVSRALVPAALARVPELSARAEELLTHSHEAVPGELAWALVLGDLPYAITRLREWLGKPRELAALLPFALTAEKEELEILLELTAKKATRQRVHALGFSGLPAAIPALVGLLESSRDDDLKLAAAFALLRLTDAPLFDDTRIAPDKLDVPDPEEPDDPAPPPRPLGQRVGDARDRPSDGSSDRALLPSTDPARWRAWLAAREAPFPAQHRLRRGKSFTPALTLLELAGTTHAPADRVTLFRELVLKTGEHHPFDPLGLVPVQTAQLDGWAAAAERASSQPGGWGRARRR